jgi:Uma2 family endonuclease
LVVEVISVSSRSEIDCDLISKPDIYAALEIPTYWVIDRRDQIVWVHTAPEDGQYTRRAQYKGRKKLPAPGLDFLAITPAQVFSF